jgi:hypothetical protein
MTETITLKEQLNQVTKRAAYNRGYLTELITALRADPFEALDEVSEDAYNKGSQQASIDIANILSPLLQSTLDREITDKESGQ